LQYLPIGFAALKTASGDRDAMTVLRLNAGSSNHPHQFLETVGLLSEQSRPEGGRIGDFDNDGTRQY
jgi:hypothetical protein